MDRIRSVISSKRPDPAVSVYPGAGDAVSPRRLMGFAKSRQRRSGTAPIHATSRRRPRPVNAGSLGRSLERSPASINECERHSYRYRARREGRRRVRRTGRQRRQREYRTANTIRASGNDRPPRDRGTMHFNCIPRAVGELATLLIRAPPRQYNFPSRAEHTRACKSAARSVLAQLLLLFIDFFVFY